MRCINVGSKKINKNQIMLIELIMLEPVAEDIYIYL